MAALLSGSVAVGRLCSRLRLAPRLCLGLPVLWRGSLGATNTIAQRSSTASTTTPEKEIAKADKQWCKALSAHNVDDLQDLYTADAILLNCPTCQPEAKSSKKDLLKPELLKLIKWFQAGGCTAATLSVQEIEKTSAAQDGTTLWDREQYLFQKDSVVKFNGNKIVVWKREKGKLKIHIDCWNQVNNLN